MTMQPRTRRAGMAAALALAAALLAGCATAPTAPVLAQAEQARELPALIPLRRFVANVDSSGGYQLSPDGKRLLWSQAVGTDTGLATRLVEGEGATRTFATGFMPRRGFRYTWLPDNRHVAYLKDPNGNENTQLHVFDAVGSDEPWAVTPWPGVRSTYAGWGEPGSSRFFFMSNRRDRASFDLYEADTATRQVREIARNDGTITSWVLDTERRIAARGRRLGQADGSDVALEIAEPDGRWRLLQTAKAFDEFWFHRIDSAAGKAWVASNIGRDKTALVEVDLASGRETVLAEHPVVDIGGALLPPLKGAPIGYVANPGMPEVRYFDAALEADIRRAVRQALARGLLEREPVVARPQGFALDGRRLVLRTEGDFDSAELLVDRQSGDVRRLDPHERELAAVLSPERPFSFRASDGRTIHGYLIRPRNAAGTGPVQGPVPLVVAIHGGPWARDYWEPATLNSAQMLANRGYAVLSVNYRGSTGYGREFMFAGAHEYFGRMQKDIAEATQWAIDQGVADPKRMAVFGASFGGFSTMAQLIRKDHDWRCGVNLVGVANWARVIENWPPFWRNRHYFTAFYGDVNKPEEKARMLANSPVSHIDAITAPMLVVHGTNDIRVLLQDSDDIVAGLRARGRQVEYLQFANEGHSVTRWRNRLELWRRVEETLAGCLGGRSAGWDFYELMPR